MPPHGCRRCCRRVVIWFPMVFITLVTCWSYYAYVLELCIFTINSNTEKAIYLAFFHLFLIMWTWCYWKTIVASHDQPSNKLCLSEEDRQLYELERRPEYKQRILRRAAKHLYTTAEEIRYCERCRMFKPNQCYHCPVCDVCVLKRDHHCPWVNNCVGFSNYKFFLLFLLYSSIYCLFISGTVLQYFMRFWTIIATMSVTGNFFTKLRSLAVTLEKETAHIEQVFNQEDDEYEDESPMRVLHDLRSEMTSLKNEIQGTIDKNLWKGQELISFIKVCKVLQKRNTADIQQIKATFQNYGYKRLDSETSENEISKETVHSESVDENCAGSDPQAPSLTALEKQAAWDLLRAPQLSDFGLSHYQLPAAWDPQSNKLHARDGPEEKPKPSYKDIRSVQIAKTPKCALTMEDDFSQIQHFGISDYSTNLNDDYTIALINKKKTSGAEKSKESSRNVKNMLATPAHLTYRNDFSSVDSPSPPVFCTPGLKVHKKEESGLKDGDHDTDYLEGAADVSDNAATLTCTLRDVKSHFTLPAYLSLRSDKETVDSPHPPTFCTPGLKVHKKYIGCEAEEPSESKEVAERRDTPPVPSFETKWLQSDTLARSLDITEPIPRPKLTYNLHLDEAAAPAVHSDEYYGNPTKTTSPPKMRDFCIGTPPRPEMTTNLTEDVFKYNMKMASPPKVSEYENLLWTPTRPEMTSCMTEDISQMLSKYCADKAKSSWNNPQSISIGKINMENKENRP
ncbi:SKA complex subunit 3-like [Mixophyes fleayi]|uniref:SKA complex subunit 3-like n=1 Tax=Mixophyes fleayi TaxID=3061075 RepID=UPI003F4E08B0